MTEQDSPEPYLQSGQAQEAQQPLAALKLYQAGLARWPQNRALLSQSGQLLTRLGQYAQAKNLLLQAQSLAALGAAELEALSICQLELGALTEAQGSLKTLQALEPDQAMPCILGALAAEQLEQPQSAIQLYLRALELAPETTQPEQAAQIYHNLGNLYRQQGRYVDSEQAWEQALKLNRQQRETQFNRQIVQNETQSRLNLLQEYRNFLLREPQSSTRSVLLCRMGELLGLERKFSAAFDCLSLALSLEPQALQAYCLMGDILREQNLLEAAQALYLRAFDLKQGLRPLPAPKPPTETAWQTFLQQLLPPPDKNTALKLSLTSPREIAALSATLLQRLELTPATIENTTNSHHPALRPETLQALAQQPEHLEPSLLSILAGLAGVLEKQRQFASVLTYLQPLLEAGIEHPTLACRYASSALACQQYASLRHYLERCLQAPDLTADQRRAMLFWLGAVHDREQRPTEAFACFEKANALKPRKFNARYCRQQSKALIECFDRSLLQTKALQAVSHTGPKPIFIVGMPRSGSTLIEQILCSHSQVFGAGEVNLLSQIFYHLLPPDMPLQGPALREVFAQHSVTELQSAAQTYLKALQKQSDGGTYLWITDKMLDNFRFLGLIDILFPEAVILHAVRHPLDICISCFSKEFTHIDYSFHLDDLGLYYQQYQRLMQHWKQVLSHPILDLPYEKLVSQPEPMIRHMLAACGLSWEAQCLHFYHHPRPVYTASAEQVRQPLYQSSVARHRAYAPFLQRFQKWLEPRS